MTRPATYLDHNASAPLLPESREAVVAALALEGNPSSVHGHGRALRNLVEAARAEVGRHVYESLRPGDVVLTLGAGDITRVAPELVRWLSAV